MNHSRFGDLADFLVGKYVTVECEDHQGRDWNHRGTVIGCHPEAVTLDLGPEWPITIVPWHMIEGIKVVDRGS